MLRSPSMEISLPGFPYKLRVSLREWGEVDEGRSYPSWRLQARYVKAQVLPSCCTLGNLSRIVRNHTGQFQESRSLGARYGIASRLLWRCNGKKLLCSNLRAFVTTERLRLGMPTTTVAFHELGAIAISPVVSETSTAEPVT